MAISPGLAAYKLSYQISPILLTGGIAGSIPGAALPIISITESLSFVTGLLSGGSNIDLDSFFANYAPLPGSTLIDQKVATYPFGNQTVAANAVIAQPLAISMLMMIPVREAGGYATKALTMLALQTALAQHINMGGTFTVATPSYFYNSCLLVSMRDVANAQSKQAQNTYQLDFSQPLLTLTQAAQAQNSQMSKISNGVPTDGSSSGLGQAVGYPQSLAAPSLVPAASGAGAAGIAPPVIPVQTSPLGPITGS